MRSRLRSLSLLSLLSMLLLAPAVHAKATKPVTPVTARVAATQIDLEVAEVGKDGTRRATTLTLVLPDRSGRGGPQATELKTRVAGDRGETAEYDVKVQPEETPAGTLYYIELRRSGGDPTKSFDMRVEVARVLKLATPVQIGRVARPDGSGMTVTATVR